MNRYQSSAPRAAFAMAAIGMTAITLALSVIVPANINADREDARALASPSVGAMSNIQVAIEPAPIERTERIQVVGVRDPKLTSLHAPIAQSKRKQQG